MCLVDTTGQGRSLPGLKRHELPPVAEDDQTDPSMPWKVGFSETAGSRNKSVFHKAKWLNSLNVDLFCCDCKQLIFYISVQTGVKVLQCCLLLALKFVFNLEFFFVYQVVRETAENGSISNRQRGLIRHV